GSYWDPATRWGQRLGDTKLIDSVLGGLTDPFGNGHMGVTAENVAEKYDISREAQDELALQSNQRAAAAIQAGYFKEQILPIEYTVKGKTVVFDTDEHVRADTTLEKLAKLPPVFKANGTVTAGNASGMNDAAAGPAHGAHQPQWQWHLDGSPGGRDRLHSGGEGAVRTAPDRRQVCAGHAVHWWRAGNRGDLRGYVSPPAEEKPVTLDQKKSR